MDLLTGDRRTPNPDDFPEQITPFPETTDLLYDHPTAAIPSPEITHRSNLPPQKLRPIRCNGKNLLEYSDPTANPQGSELLENGGFSENLLSCRIMDSPEVRFLSDQLCALNGDPKELSDSAANVRIGDLTEKCGDVAGNEFRAAETKVAAAAAPEFRSGMDAEYGNQNLDYCASETESSSSSDYGDDSSEEITEPVNRKRKRKPRKKLEFFLENLVMKVMQKQEQMHNQLIEMIEMKEKERIIREEAWKQQEMERAKREEEVRAQETSRSLALISFIQNVLGHVIQIPKPLQTSCLEEDQGEVHNQQDAKNDRSDERWPKTVAQAEDDINNRICPETEVQTNYDPSNKRWPKSEVQSLIALRTSFDHKFRTVGAKGSIWEEISVGLSNMGYSRTAKKCKEKWENINKYFKRTVESGKKRPETAKACPYFQELEILYKSGFIGPTIALNNINNEIENNSAQK